MRMLLRFAGGFAGAAFLTILLLPGAAAPALAAVLLIPAVVLCVRRTQLGPVFLGLAVGLLWTFCYGMILVTPVSSLAGQTVEITGTATGYSSQTTYGIRVPAEIAVGTKSARATVWLYTREPIQPGDAFSVTAELRAPDGENADYYRSEGVFLLAYGKGTPEITAAAAVPLRYLPATIAHRLEQSLRQCVPEDALGCAMALATGNRDALSTLERETMKTAGIYHLLALSGMHMAVLVGAVSLLTRRRRTRALIGIPLCIVFALITGGRPSIVRAAVMQCLMLTAPLLGREEDAPTALGAAGLLLAVQNPWCLLGWGLQLSFASMAGILLLSNRLFRVLGGQRAKRGFPGTLWRGAASSLSATLSAFALTLPLMIAYFGRICLIAPAANLLTGWAAAWCFRGSLLTALVGLVSPGAGSVLGWLLGWCIRYVQGVASLLSRVPFASLSVRTVYGVGWVVLVYGVGILAAGMGKERRPVIPVCCILLGLCACLLLTTAERRGVSMTVLDVGQGQCLLLSSGGQTVMVDCGGSLGEATGDLAASELTGLGEDRVDVLVLTHYDADHTRGVGELLQRMPVGTILLPDMEDGVRDDIEARARDCGTGIFVVDQQTLLRFGTGSIFVYPPVTDTGGNSGLSLLLDAGNIQALVTGDMDDQAEAALLRTYDIPDVDILVAGHHGSRSSTSQLLLDAASPEIAVISVGENSYGHPAEETLARLRQAGAAVFRTDQHGTLTLKGA